MKENANYASDDFMSNRAASSLFLQAFSFFSSPFSAPPTFSSSPQKLVCGSRTHSAFLFIDYDDLHNEVKKKNLGNGIRVADPAVESGERKQEL